MNITLKLWSEVSEKSIEQLYLENPYPLYRGTPLCNHLMKSYLFELAREDANTNKKRAFVALVDGKPVVAGQIKRIPYLTEYWGFAIGALGHLVVDKSVNEKTLHAAEIIISELLEAGYQDGLSFISTVIPGPSIALANALEKNGFYYAEGFINMVGPSNDFRDEFNVPGLAIREAADRDFKEIADAYSKVVFPSRFVADMRFNSEKGLQLYHHRFKEVYKQKLGKIFVAELEGRFAGALIAIIDEKMANSIGVKTNILSGMGIIVHPRASRKGVSLALIEHRQAYYKSQNVDYVSFGANFNNRPMILGLTKLGLTFGSLDMTFHHWQTNKNK